MRFIQSQFPGFVHSDRYPFPPYILNGYPKNVTAVKNSTVWFECPILSDMEAHFTWAKVNPQNDTNGVVFPNSTILKVLSKSIVHTKKKKTIFGGGILINRTIYQR